MNHFKSLATLNNKERNKAIIRKVIIQSFLAEIIIIIANFLVLTVN